MAATLTVARVRGIPVRLHVTFLLVLPVFAWLMATAYFMEPRGAWPDAVAWAWGALLAVGLFLSVLLHELAHSLVALREGIRVRHITLLPIGGVSAFETMPREPGAELRVTIVGPLTNFIIGLPVLLVWWLGVVPDALPGLERFAFTFALVNLVIGGFNLFLPAFPMDGGRILRALLTPRLGRIRATDVAANAGRLIAVAMGLFGLLTGGWLLVLIAFFVYQGAGQEAQATRMAETIGRFRVGDIMSTPVETLPAGMSVEEAFERAVRQRHLAFPVVGSATSGRPVGVVTLEAMRAVPEAQRWTVRLGELASARTASLSAHDDATTATSLLSGGAPLVLVLDAEGNLEGVVSATDVLRLTQILEAKEGGRGRGHARPL